MAQFATDIQAITGITISETLTYPTQDELAVYLSDGVLDVTEKTIKLNPRDKELFMRVTDDIAENDVTGVDGAEIISVLRSESISGDYQWRPCRRIPQSQQTQVLDKESFSYASEYNPAYLIGPSQYISVFPVPADIVGYRFKVYYVNNVPAADNDGALLAYNSTTIAFFPKDKIRLVLMYASLRALSRHMHRLRDVLGLFTLKTVPPDLPLQGTSLPTYSVTDLGSESLGEQIEQMRTYIETNQDVELANAKQSEINAILKLELEAFNSKIQEWQTENAGESQRYQAEIAGYQSEVQAEVQEYQSKTAAETAKYQWIQERFSALQAEYLAEFVDPAPAQQGGR